MAGPKITKAGGAEIRKVGHTVGKNHGTNATATQLGEPREGQATPVKYNGS